MSVARGVLIAALTVALVALGLVAAPAPAIASRLCGGTTADYMETTSMPFTAAPFSVSCWCRADTTTAADFLWCACDPSANNNLVESWACNLSSTNVLTFNISTVALGVSNPGTVDATTDGAWSQCACIETSSVSHRVLLDGGAQASNANGKAPAGVNRFTFGLRRDLTPDGPMVGAIGPTAVWSVAITNAENTELALGLHPYSVSRASLVAYWPMLGVASPEPSMKGSYPLTITGTVTAANMKPLRGGNR